MVWGGVCYLATGLGSAEVLMESATYFTNGLISAGIIIPDFSS